MTDGSSATAYVPTTDVVSRRVGQGAVLVHLATNRIFELNATGARIWELMEAQADRDAILQSLAAEFDVAPEQASEELNHLIGELQREGLLQS
jgi:hypothetical protein